MFVQIGGKKKKKEKELEYQKTGGKTKQYLEAWFKTTFRFSTAVCQQSLS